ncbi:hypothetical protein EST38_g418 [Candolleomyces aberdarensis]|uniref:Mitochondrial distribution and morphology protein 34 n=1 Tax=Candolleomyces aberdarensis TaxID=2316362 RepID=A0A4Q2DXJ6_9AGAR|nr:hypothetical protein EST38_g418 [Candolleomyces aberdarensis]
MSFTFSWPRFSDQFHYDAIQMLNTALNKGNKPPIIADKIEVVELEMGTQPPELEIRDIGDLTTDQFRGIFRLTYNGDAHLVLKTKVQANPLNHKLPDIHQLSGSTGMLAAKQPLVVPMLLRLSHFKLSSYVVLVVSKQKGITIVFKTDPLQNVDISSTFDSIAVIQSFIQREIEGQLRQMFREDLPSIIHRLSQQWVKAKVETPYQKQNQSSLKKAPPPTPSRQGLETMSTPDIPLAQYSRNRGAQSDVFPSLRPPLSTSKRPRSTAGMSTASHRLLSPLSAPPITNTTSNSSSSTLTPHDPEDEPFDPTYGLRPEGLPTKPVFKGFSNLFQTNKGLVDLAEESLASSTIDDDESDYQDSSGSLTEEEGLAGDSFDFVDWSGPVQSNTPPEPQMEYETIPAIGGGTITRPRVVHSQSQIQSPPGIIASNLGTGLASSSSRNLAGVFSAANAGSGTPGVLSRNPSNPYFASAIPPNSAPPTMGTAQRFQSFEGIQTNATKKAAYAHSAQEDAIYTRPHSARNPFPHPYDLERQRYDLHDDEYDDDEAFDEDDDHESIRQRRIRNFQQRQQQQEYLSMRSTPSVPPSSIASSPPRLGMGRPQSRRRLSVSSNTTTRTSSSAYPSNPLDPSSSSSVRGSSGNPPKIVLRPSLLNNSIHHLSTLSQSNHTLSPYTRSVEHFAVRSGPPRALSAIVRSSSASATAAPSVAGDVFSASHAGGIGSLSPAANVTGGRSRGGATAGIVGLSTRLGKSKAEVVVKAKRKRTYRIGGSKKKNSAEGGPEVDPSPVQGGPASEYDRRSSWYAPDGSSYGQGVSGQGKERHRPRRRRRSSLQGTDFDEDMDRYFKSMQVAEETGELRPSLKGEEQDRR